MVAAVISQTSVIVEGWRALHDAHIPTMIYGAFDNSLLGDTQSTFVLGSAFASLSDFPIAVAKKTGKKKISAVVIDVPAATGFFVGPAKGVFNKAGLDYALARIPPRNRARR